MILLAAGINRPTTVWVELPGAAWQDYIVGMVRLALALPLRGIVRATLTMTEIETVFL